MAAPNIVNVTNINGRTFGNVLTTSNVIILANGASSGNVLKINNIDSDQLLKLCKYFLNILIKQESKIIINSTDNADEIVCALATVILECAKNNSSVEQMR